MRNAWRRIAVISLVGCGETPVTFWDAGGDGPNSNPDAMVGDAASSDASTHDASDRDGAAPSDASARTYRCGDFATAPTWTLPPGFHAVVIADESDGLNQPVAVAIAGGAFEGKLYVVNQGDNRLVAIDPDSGDGTVVVASAGWPTAPGLLTAIAHDATGAFDGSLYVGDQGGNGDSDSKLYRVTAAGVASQFAAGPGPGLDDVFALEFSPGGAHPAGLYATGDTDGALPDWGVFDVAGTGVAFSEVAGAESIAVDRLGTYGGGLWAARPAGGGYAGDDSIGPIDASGNAGPRLATVLPGIHGIAFAPPGPFGGRLHAASWDTGRLISISTAGVVAELATGLSLTNYDANMLAFSPDGNVLYVADRSANRLVCIEPIPGE